MNRVNEIEYMVACNELTAAQVFTQMRQLIPNKNIEAERDALQARLDEAIDRIKDILKQDDGQAYKEAEKFLDKLEGEG